MKVHEIIDCLFRKVWDLSEPLNVRWRYPTRRPRDPRKMRTQGAWQTLDPTNPVTLKANDENWFYADLVFPAKKAGMDLGGTKGSFFLNLWCPFTLWLDDRELFRETHAWQATGPIWDPVLDAIEPGRTHRLVLCLRPDAGMSVSLTDPGTVMINALPCVETGVDVAAVASELNMALTLASRQAERTRVAKAAERLDMRALGNNDWPAFFTSAQAMEESLGDFADRARAITVHVLGYTHIDMDWMWTWNDTVHCIRRDYRAVAELMEEAPGLTFGMSQIPTYEAVRQKDPEVFRKVSALVRQGRWENLAGTWVEGDLNMADGEAVARHVLYAADWSRRYLGKPARVFWAPDTFGHPGNLPQLAMLAEQDTYFHTRCAPGGEKDPWPARVWQGIDGTEVLALSSPYQGHLVLPEMIGVILMPTVLRCRRLGLNTAFWVWGMGDHGGGLPRENIRLLERFRRRPLMPSFKFSTVKDLRKDLWREKDKLPKSVGETQAIFEGCYTTHSRMKKYNRQCEGALLTAETVAAMAGLNRNAVLGGAWRGVLFNQFHDLLGGAAAAAPYRNVYRRANAALRVADRVTKEAMARLFSSARSGRGWTVINPLGFCRTEVTRAPLPKSVRALVDANEQAIPVQHTDREALIAVRDVAAFSWKGYAISTSEALANHFPIVSVTPDQKGFTIETVHYCCRLDRESGAIVSYLDKRLRRDMIGYGTPRPTTGGAVDRSDLALNVFQILDESPHAMTAWLIHRVVREETLLRGATVELREVGPVFARFRLTHVCRASRIDEDIYFYRDSPRIDFEATVDWRERGGPQVGVPQLKVSFAAAVRSARVRSEGPYTIVERPADGQEQCTQKWVDVTGRNFGFTVYNDSRYGFDALGGRLRLTLLRSAYFPDPDPDHGVHVVKYAFEPHGPDISPATFVKNGLAYNRPLIGLGTKSKMDGGSPPIEVLGARGVVCTALRRAEHSADLLVRLFETEGKPCRVRIKFAGGVRSIREVNFLENSLTPSRKPRNGVADVRFHPFEVKTIAIRT